MFIIRFLGRLLELLAAFVLIAALISWFMGKGFMGQLTGQMWFGLHSTSLQQAQPAVERYLTPFLWHDVIAPVLGQPVWLVFLVLAISGFLLTILARR